MNVYLAGPINGCTDDEATSWRDLATEKLAKYGVETYDPMVRDYRGRELEPGIATEIVENDKKDIDKCSHVLVMYTKPSVGTSMEVLYSWDQGTPVVLVDLSEKPLSPWLLYHADFIVKSLDEAVNFLAEEFGRQ